MRINFDNEKLNYCGRIDQSNPKHPVFIFPATYLQFRFWGGVRSLKWKTAMR